MYTAESILSAVYITMKGLGMENILNMRGITKIFPGVVACNNVNFSVNKGEVMALLGENGAGKSTLIKILAGTHRRDAGIITFDGKEYQHYSPAEAMKMGISVIYQEFNLLRSLSVYENIFFGREIRKGLVLKNKEMIARTKEIFDELGTYIDPKAKIYEMSIAEQQMIEVAKAIVNDAKLIVMDEPTATLTHKEINKLFGLIKRLKEKGTAIVYISHRLEEVFEIADRVTIMRDGHFVIEKDIKDINRAEIVKYMVGRELIEKYPYQCCKEEDIILDVRHLCSLKIKNINFTLRKGEVLGFTGLVGAGRTEVMRALFGADKASGEIFIEGKKVNIEKPKHAIDNGIGFLTEDRKSQGLLLNKSITFNLTLGIIGKLSKYGIINFSKEKSIVDKYSHVLHIKSHSNEQLTKNLSGGNQQKVVLAKWLAMNSKVLIFDEPTRGIDVGAKQEIYHLINELKQQGISIILISSEMPEIIGMCDRVLVMHNGKITAELGNNELDQERILDLSVGEGRKR